jgi:hypothetical protein
MTLYSMSDHPVNVPDLTSIDRLAEQREQRDQRTRSRMSKKLYKDQIFQALAEAMEDERHPVGELVAMLWDAPLRDPYDYRAFLEMRDGRRLGATVLTMVCDASLAAYQQADADEGF